MKKEQFWGIAKVAKEDHRSLGEEWTGWDGEGGETVEEGKALFLFSSVAVLLLVAGLALLHWYLIVPRLRELGPYFYWLISWLIFGFIALSGLWAVMMIISSATEKNFFLLCGRQNITIALNYIMPLAFRIGERMGFSKDRMGSSFVKVSNSLIRATAKAGECKLLVILPRCLKKEDRERFLEVANSYRFDYFTAAGGTQARSIIAEKRPDAIIGVACERDLISGIRDIAPKIPVIGIPNRRPEGPCKNTTIDFNDLEKAIRFFKIS